MIATILITATRSGSASSVIINRGPTGATGSAGAAGANGADGAPGADGADGADGAPGATTFAGLTDAITATIATTNTSVSSALALKAPLANPTFTGTLTCGVVFSQGAGGTFTSGAVNVNLTAPTVWCNALGLGAASDVAFAGVTASGTVEAASYTRGGVAQQDVSTGASPTFAGGVINGSLVVTSASYPVTDTIRHTAATGDYRAAVRLRRTNSSGTSLAGIGIATYFEIPNSANAQKFAGMFGGSLSTVTSGSEIGELVFSPAWNGSDPSFKRDFVLRATSTTTADATLAGNLTASGTVEAASYTRGGVAQQDIATTATIALAGMQINNGSTTGALNLGANVNATTRTSNVRKMAALVSPDYANTRNIEWITSDSIGITTNYVYIGGRPDGSNYGATDINLSTAPNQATTGGTARIVIDRNGVISMGATAASSPSVRVAATGEVGIGTITPDEKLDVVGNIKASGTVKTGGYTVATLPTPSVGMRAYVTDANATTYASIVAGGGANVVPVFYTGTNWIIA